AATQSFFFSSRRRHTRWPRDWSSDVCSSDLVEHAQGNAAVSEVAHYDEFPGERHPMEALLELVAALGIRGRLGADHDGYPWVFRSEERRVGKECRGQGCRCECTTGRGESVWS